MYCYQGDGGILEGKSRYVVIYSLVATMETGLRERYVSLYGVLYGYDVIIH